VTADLVLCSILAELPALDRAALQREVATLRRRKAWPPAPTPAQQAAAQQALLDALAVAPGSVPRAASVWLASTPQDQARGLADDLLACLAVYLRRMPARATSLAVEDWT
jgi:hypothetical protein